MRSDHQNSQQTGDNPQRLFNMALHQMDRQQKVLLLRMNKLDAFSSQAQKETEDRLTHRLDDLEALCKEKEDETMKLLNEIKKMLAKLVRSDEEILALQQKINEQTKKYRILLEENNRLQNICRDQSAAHNREMEKQTEQHNLQITEKDRQIQECMEKNKKLAESHTMQIHELEQTLKDSREELSKLSLQQEQRQRMYQTCVALDDPNLSATLKQSSYEAFFVSCCDQNNIKKVFELAKNYLYRSTEREKNAVLDEVLDYCIEAYNSVYGPLLTRQTPQIGEAYEGARFLKEENDSSYGSVSRVLLKGIIDKQTGVLCKSLVEVR